MHNAIIEEDMEWSPDKVMEPNLQNSEEEIP